MSEPVERQPMTFTWLSLVVVALVLMIAFGVSSVFVNQARDGARKNACTSHLKQLALGIHGFHDINEHITPARLDHWNRITRGEPAPTKLSRDTLGPNWLILASPHYENQSLYEAFNVRLIKQLATDDQEENQMHDDSPLWNIDATLSIGRLARGSFDITNLSPKGSLMRCLSDPTPEIPYAGFGGGWGRGNYAINAGPCELMAGPEPAPCRLAGNAAPWGMKASGIAGVNWGVSLQELSRADGTGNTIMLTEVRVGISPDDLRGTWALGLPGASILANAAMPFAETPNSVHPQSDRIPDCDKVQKSAGGSAALARLGMGCDPQATAAEQTAARSLHVGGVNTGFCDGSVHFISNTISPRVWFRMLSRNDGEAVKFEVEE